MKQNMAGIEEGIQSPRDAMRPNTERKEPSMNTARITEYVTNPNHVADAKPGRMCGDDRYEGNNGKIARFGGDAGYALGLLGLNQAMGLGLTPEQVVDVIVENSEGKFETHTDDVAAKDTEHQHSIGCGHIKNASLPGNEDGYGVKPDDVKRLITYVKQLAGEQPDKVDIVTLSGDHSKTPVVIYNQGVDKKVSHSDGDTKFYMVDTTRDEKYAAGLFERLSAAVPQLTEKGVTLKDFREVLDAQTRTTANILAPSAPVFTVNVDTPIAQVLPAGTVK